jgi:hypothetical protein
LKPERNALQALVFPRLELLCAQNGFRFQAIDLRFRLRQGCDGLGGVSNEAGLDHRTMRICFDELRRAQDISPAQFPDPRLHLRVSPGSLGF